MARSPVHAVAVIHHNASVYLTVDRRHNRISILVIDAEGVKHLYAVTPHPTEAGNVALMEVG